MHCPQDLFCNWSWFHGSSLGFSEVGLITTLQSSSRLAMNVCRLASHLIFHIFSVLFTSLHLSFLIFVLDDLVLFSYRHILLVCLQCLYRKDALAERGFRMLSPLTLSFGCCHP